MEEVKGQLAMFEELLQGNDEYLQRLRYARGILPHVFQLLDANSDRSLTKKELSYVTKFEESMKKGGALRGFLRDTFEILDTDRDDQWSVDELYAAIPAAHGSSESLSKIAKKFHNIFPLRSTAAELEDFILTCFRSIGGGEWTKESVKKGMAVVDKDGDGLIQRKEVGKTYNEYGKEFLKMCTQIKTMGPMFAMFQGGMKTEF
eukprot:CAMPEP_0172495240 /NCGR_PEP_ID=MMETSP1066-20121228/65435_1 /TAXON_ID=671091 /ORGANISM="Coscinodiscus wailesii, Strain CCMP2513" /LENGTH=203 /DNA_ID=CAMNT_0013266787 /DNA_START=199 /DNA_END=810 /DNA_ORIENTATION=+